MADNKKIETPVQQPAETFEAAEIAANAPRLFGYSVDIATAALAYKGVKRCSLVDAKMTIKNFAERKV